MKLKQEKSMEEIEPRTLGKQTATERNRYRKRNNKLRRFYSPLSGEAYWATYKQYKEIRHWEMMQYANK